MASVTGFVGYECEDIVLYLAKICTELGKKVAVVDRTEQEMLLEWMGKNRQEEEQAHSDYDGIRITSRIEEEAFDLVFIVFGYRLNHPKLYSCENLVMVTDGVPAHAAILRRIGLWDRRQCLVARNLVDMAHGTRYLQLLSEQKGLWIEIFLDDADIRVRCSLGEGGRISLGALSPEMKKAVSVLTEWIMQEDRKAEIKKIIKGVKKRKTGGVSWES